MNFSNQNLHDFFNFQIFMIFSTQNLHLVNLTCSPLFNFIQSRKTEIIQSFYSNKVTTRWEGPQSLPCNKHWLGKDGLLLIQTCTSKHVCMNVWPIYQHSHHHKSNCQKAWPSCTQIWDPYVCMTHITALTPS